MSQNAMPGDRQPLTLEVPMFQRVKLLMIANEVRKELGLSDLKLNFDWKKAEVDAGLQASNGKQGYAPDAQKIMLMHMITSGTPDMAEELLRHISHRIDEKIKG